MSAGGSGKAPKTARLVLADGTVYRGLAFGAEAVRSGEVVFNTSMTGYQEILTDPSYAGQIVTMTYTQIGNVGVNPTDEESSRPFLEGFVVKELCEFPSSLRAEGEAPVDRAVGQRQPRGLRRSDIPSAHGNSTPLSLW